MAENIIQLSTGDMTLTLQTTGKRLQLVSWSDPFHAWLHPANTSRLFAAYINRRCYDTSNLTYLGLQRLPAASGVAHFRLRFAARHFELDQHILVYERYSLLETWPVIRNIGNQGIRIHRLDAFSFDLKDSGLPLSYYTSGWGQEFEPHILPVTRPVTLQTRLGRSSNGQHPWFALQAPSGRILAGSIAWSGNWIFRFQPLASGGLRLSGGIHSWRFEKLIHPGESLQSPPCILTLGADLDAVANQYAQTGRRYGYPRNELSSRLPVEWNHWWSYEDAEINAEVFAQNVDAAASLGIEVCTLDAGWFGPSDPGTQWYDYRGDWNQINQVRFPQGIRPLADRVHALGMRFGLWCEIEGLGRQASLAQEHPDFVALREGQRLGYVCFGNPAVQEWAYQTLACLIQEHGCDWIKLDFNLDPGPGCNRADHGHQAGDGLFAHYQGYYRTLERLRQAFPEVVLENCSSGGLRIDLGILRHTHMTFLSDPDWPVHDLQIFWGASTMLAPSACLHWSFSHWRSQNPPPQQTFNPHSPSLTQKQLDYYTRIAMLGWFGISQKLPSLPAWVSRRLAYHIRIYKDHVRRFIRQADLYRLTGQPRRSGMGERWCAFQYSLPGSDEHLLFVFRLPGSPASRSIQLRNLQEERLYTLHDLDGDWTVQKTGQELMSSGIAFQQLAEEDSALLWAH
jgi:alpha-galactosidase